MANETNSLLPCPFCGDTPELPSGDGTQYEIECGGCGQAIASVQICDLMTIEERTTDSFTNYRYSEQFVERAKNAAIANWNDRTHPAQPEQQPLPPDQAASLADRMRAAGMFTVDEMLSGAPLDSFIRHAGVCDLETYRQWLDMKCREFLAMQASRELEKREDDDLYEWVLAHAAAFQEARINFKAAMGAVSRDA